jgi:hypothetical protein
LSNPLPNYLIFTSEISGNGREIILV